MMNQEVRSIMSRDVITAHPDQSIEEITAVMVREQLQQLPVVKEGKFEGLITSYDLWKRLRSTPEIGHLRVKDLMNTHVIKISPKDKVGTAAELFADKRFKTLPVVNLNNELKGIVTAFDLIKTVFNEEYKEPILYKEVFAST